MWTCGGELVPDIVSYNTVMKACGNAQQTDRAFEVGATPAFRSIDVKDQMYRYLDQIQTSRSAPAGFACIL
jgi:hypothetical protein